eukprot:225709-Chlamydomonas_euryale.AAC.1
MVGVGNTYMVGVGNTYMAGVGNTYMVGVGNTYMVGVGNMYMVGVGNTYMVGVCARTECRMAASLPGMAARASCMRMAQGAGRTAPWYRGMAARASCMRMAEAGKNFALIRPVSNRQAGQPAPSPSLQQAISPPPMRTHPHPNLPPTHSYSLPAAPPAGADRPDGGGRGGGR